MKIIGTGLSGLVGSRIVELLSPEFQFENLSRNTGTDITNKKNVFEKIQNSSAKILLHLAAKTDVDSCEKEKDLGEGGECWKINVLGTENIINACLQTNKLLVLFSTDMIFSGEKQLGFTYSEEDKPEPCNWYSQTKYEAEKRVMASKIPFIILRIAYPYRGNYEKKEYVRIFYSLLKEGKEISVVKDNYFTPTFIDDIPEVLKNLLERNQTGIFHLGGNGVVSPFECANIIAREFGFDKNLIKSTIREIFFKGRAYRPFNTGLKNARISELGLKTRSFEEGLKILKKQLT